MANSRICGVLGESSEQAVLSMLEKMAPAPSAEKEIFGGASFTLGRVFITPGENAAKASFRRQSVSDGFFPDNFPPLTAIAETFPGLPPGARLSACLVKGENSFHLLRDHLGRAPLYHARREGHIFFASEIKALAGLGLSPETFPPGQVFSPESGWRKLPAIKARRETFPDPLKAAGRLRDILAGSVRLLRRGGCHGSWLSGGLDSAALAALAAREGPVETFSIGLKNSPDLEHAAAMAEWLGSRHHERLVDIPTLAGAVPGVIYRLESFDAPLVRSSLFNQLLAEMSAEQVSSVFSGEGADELFAGYGYLRELDPPSLDRELRRLPGLLHNTSLQRVDRMAAGHGLEVCLPFLEPPVVAFASCLPAPLKLFRRGPEEVVDKWVLRQALKGLLPEGVRARPKEKFWEGGGLNDLMEGYAEKKISRREFERNRKLPDGSQLRSREEMFYYRVFREFFGGVDLSTVGRTVT